MTLEELKQYLNQKRGEHLEFFESKTGLDYRMFDTVCAFLNTNVNKYLSVYSDGAIPTFDEENIFTTVIPLKKENIRMIPEGISEGLSEGINEGLNEGLSEGLNEGLIREISDDVRKNLNELLLFLYQNEGVQTNDIAGYLAVSVKTVERYIRTLKKLEIIKYKGAKKTGGYYLSGSFKNRIK